MTIERSLQRYCGRFAPSPTGPLHFGSLVAAVGSYLDARRHDGLWYLRMEDVDRQRCPSGMSSEILHLLDDYGFEWDGEVIYQSLRDGSYRAALEHLHAAGRVFPCTCTRNELADSQLSPPVRLASDGALIYPGTCRTGLSQGRSARTWRLRVNDESICFDDAIQGRIEQDLPGAVGDFVLLRADGFFAYQLAVVVDDAEQGISHVVRGADLLYSTPRQILLQRLLGLPTPRYGHLPVALNAAGEKLSKQSHAVPLCRSQAIPAVLAALRFLGQEPPLELHDAALGELWQWAIANYSPDKVPHSHAVVESFT